MPYTQWSSTEGNYTPVDNTIAEIRAGYYDLDQDNQGRLWFVPIRPGTDELLNFPDSASLRVLQHIKDFWTREAVFKKYGMPFKRGILMYGAPGAGKTSCMQLIARDVVERGGVVITFPNSTDLFLSAYRALRDIQPETPVVVLMEDFESTLKRVNESRLLNLLDGVEKLHKVVFLASTNYIEQLEPRIRNRPSRFDVRVRVDLPSATARRMYLTSLLRDGDVLDVEQYVKDTEKKSLAHVKELFIATHVMGLPYGPTVKRLTEMEDDTVSSKDDEDQSNWFVQVDELGEELAKQYARTVGQYL